MNYITVKQKGRIFKLRIPKEFRAIYIYGKGLGLIANRHFSIGEPILPLRGKLVPLKKASDEAVQFDARRFIDTPYLVPEDFINHSCDPNTAIDFYKRQFFSIKPIKKNDEISFNYLAVEYDIEKMGGGFKCICGSKNCARMISGYRYLSHAQKARLEQYFSPFLKRKWEQEK